MKLDLHIADPSAKVVKMFFTFLICVICVINIVLCKSICPYPDFLLFLPKGNTFSQHCGCQSNYSLSRKDVGAGKQCPY